MAVRLKLERIKEMNKLLGFILKDQGEGIMARRPGSPYVTGRSTNLLKIKSTRSDREAIVVAVSDKGAVRLKLPDNNIFTIQPKNVEIKTPPKKGEVVTFTFESLSNKGMPYNARIVRVRSDLSWDDVVAAYKSENKEDSVVDEKPLGFLEKKNRQVREFFEKFAKNRNRDPLDPESWYDVQAAEIKAVRGGAWIMRQMGWELPRILPNVFSEVKFNTNFFKWRPKLQIDIEKRRNYFIKLAEEKGFDPLVAEGWYSFKPYSLDPMGLKLMRFYRFSTSRVITNLFPEIKFDITKFRSVTHGYWKSMENRRAFFVKFAEEHAFDPLVPEHWYDALNSTGLVKDKNAHGIALYYQSSIPRALASLFPDIGLRLPRFNTKIVNFLKDKSNLRIFYEEFAFRYNFDPLVPENWRYVRKRDLLKARAGNAAKEVTGGSLLKGLRTAFPEVNFDETHANYVLRSFYADARNKRDFFLKLAAIRGFDPNDDKNWYKLNRSQLIGIEGGATLIVLHGGSMSSALLEAFPNLDPTKFAKKKKNTIKKMEENVLKA